MEFILSLVFIAMFVKCTYTAWEEYYYAVDEVDSTLACMWSVLAVGCMGMACKLLGGA